MKNLVLALFFILPYSVYSQGFMPGFDRFSGRKTAYITLKDGQKIEGNIKKIKRKKGSFRKIKILNEGKKVEFSPDNVATMYLPADGLERLAQRLDYLDNAATYSNMSLNMKTISEGYAYFESTEVMVNKKKTRHLMMQLVNPHMGSKMKVYFDPVAKTTMKVGGGIGPSFGGVDKSYYYKLGDAPARKVQKKNYKKELKTMYGDCPTLLSRLSEKLTWSGLAKDVDEYSRCGNSDVVSK
ncbi:hypothetical protein CLV98_104431 [Dyadobacter jejuensis]|uniref:Uncharacterized protein n=1 Tax=Dyadobacter jejuensis TaxID=1082580 RepID=A0A316ALX6_9BACT|nr:hypothetical protein [Dyadobacter jejuensis]PWJ58571.1 hypothetical protein CLV98_104431 [Dyadobacter jejuensis]